MRHLDVELDDEDVEHAGEDLHALDQLHLLLQCLKKFHPKVRNHGEGPY